MLCFKAATEGSAFSTPRLGRTATISPALVAGAGMNIGGGTYSSTSREVLSALRITHVVKHNDGSESDFTTSSPYIKDADSGVLRMWYWPRRAQLFLENLAHNWHTGMPKSPAKQQFSTDSQSANLFGRPIAVVAAYRPVSGLPTTHQLPG